MRNGTLSLGVAREETRPPGPTPDIAKPDPDLWSQRGGMMTGPGSFWDKTMGNRD